MKNNLSHQGRASFQCFSVLCLILACVPISAQEVSKKEDLGPSTPKDDTVVELSLFEVMTTQDKGYVTTNAATGFKTNQPLLNIPQAITVMTRDLIDDVGFTSSSDALQFAGVARHTVGTEAVMLRGSRIANPFRDEFPNGSHPYLDNVNIDSYEVIRGPAAVFYINSSLGGAILMTTRKPLPYRSGFVSFSADQHGTYRATLDSTGPLGSIGEGKFSYRLNGVVKGGDQFFRNRSEETFGVFPTLQFKYRDTTVRVAYDYTRLKHYPQAHSFLTPEGQVYTGAGRDENYQAPNNLEDFSSAMLRFQMLHRFSEGWEMKFSASNSRFKRGPTGIILPAGGINYITETITFTARRNFQDQNSNFVIGDVSGNYDLFGLKSQTIAGFQFTDGVSDALFQGSTSFGGGTGRVTRPIANPDMDSIVIPDLSTYIPPAAPRGGRFLQQGLIAYIQQQVDVIPNRLSLVAGWSKWDREASFIANPTLPQPLPADQRPASGTLHRYGVVGYINKEISIYALESTILQPNVFGIDATGAPLPNQLGTGQEIGIKTALFGGRVSSTLSFFDIGLSNQSSFGGVLPDGRSFQNLIGSTSQKGWDIDLALKLLPNWQVVATYFRGDNKTATGAPISLTYKSSWSFFTRYDFTGDAFKGLSIGGGAAAKGGYIVGSGGLTLPTPAAFINVKDGTSVNVFANYAINKHWSVRVNVENVLDAIFPAGMQAAWLVDPSNPRTFTFASTYKF